MSVENSQNGVYINGKRQVIELLQVMNSADKIKLLKNLKLRNPTLAKELYEHCISFDSIWDLSEEQLKILVNQVQPTILGLALSLCPMKNQRRALSLISRQNALKAFEIMQKDLSGNRQECLKAQKKVLEAALQLQKNRVINFF